MTDIRIEWLTDDSDCDRAGCGGGTTPATPDIATQVERLADDILRAAGSGLKHYTDYTRRRILAVALEAYEAAYRAGANRALRLAKEATHD